MEKNLDQIVLEPSAFSVRKLLRKPAIYLTTIALGLLSCETNPGTQLVPPSNPSGNGTNQYCQTDYDCLEESQVCENGYCVYSPSQPVGSYDPGSTPYEAFSKFQQKLSAGDLEDVLTVFDGSVRERIKKELLGVNLQAKAQEIKNLSLTPVKLFQDSSGKTVGEYEFELNGIRYPIIFYQEEGGYLIHGI